ncbi:MAG: hypothetical protein HFI88_10085 [Lachnospiraceae bacterium]|nr:hypothetical protein [Lachnospiraceae bacterium]
MKTTIKAMAVALISYLTPFCRMQMDLGDVEKWVQMGEEEKDAKGTP